MDRAADYLEHCVALFRSAQELSGESARQSLRIGSFTVELHFAGKAMGGKIMPALAHLKSADVAAPDLRLHIWDSESTGAPPLRPQWGLDAYGAYGLIRGFNSERFHVVAQLNPHILRCVDHRAGVGIYWTKSARELPWYELAAPLRPLLHDWLQRKGMLPIHGAAVGFERGGVLLAGSSGAGKSNLALACLDSPLRYVGDDFCALSADPWTAHSLYCSGKVHADSLGRLPHLRDSLSNPEMLETEKAVFFLKARFADRLIGRFPLRAIVLPRQCPGEPTELAPVSAAAAQKALAMSTIELSRATAAFTFRQVAMLVRSLPCHELRVGTQGDRAPALIAELLSGLN